MAHRPRRAQQRNVDRDVRSLLADARHTEPMPVDVAARLDQVLVDLAAQERPGQQPDAPRGPAPAAPVTDLAARRRRRATTLLAAAAAVVAVGVGVDRLASSSSSSGSSSATAGHAEDGPAQSGAGADAGGSGAPAERSPAGGAPQGLTAGQQGGTLPALVRVRPGHFSEDAARARRVARAAYDAASAGTQDSAGSRKQERNSGSVPGPARPGFTCEPAAWGPGRILGVRYGHAPAVLVLRAPQGDTQVVDLYRCGSTDLLRSSTLPRS